MNYEEFFETFQHLSSIDHEDVEIAYSIAKNAHRLQERDTGERYFEHVRGVALILIELGYTNASIIVKALLHDVLEDSYFHSGIIVRCYGTAMYNSLLNLSKVRPIVNSDTGRYWRQKVSDEIYYKGLKEGEKEDKIVKCADRLHNLRSMKNVWELARQVEYARNTQRYIIPMAMDSSAMLCRALEAEVSSVFREADQPH